MRHCIECGHKKSKVTENYARNDGKVRRTRECKACGYLFTTLEILEHHELNFETRKRLLEKLKPVAEILEASVTE